MKALRSILLFVAVAGLCLVSGSLPNQLQAQGTTPTINSGGIVNVASYALTSTSVAPGSIAAIFGSNLSNGTACVGPLCGPSFDSNGKVIPTLAGASVTFNGIAAPILSTPGSGQLNVQVPVELAGAASATVVVTVTTLGGASASAPRTVPLAVLSPGLIAANASGAGQGAILNDKDANQGVQSFAAPAGSAQNAHPAAPGDVIEIYATGLGAVTPSVATGMRPQGLPQTVTKPIVTIGGIPATVAFPGLASCCVGLNQVNVVVPSGTPTGNSIPVVLSIGGVQANTVTIAVSPGGPPTFTLQGTANSVSGNLPGVDVTEFLFNLPGTGNVPITATGVSSGGQTVYTGSGSGSGTVPQCANGSTGNWTASVSAFGMTLSPAITSLVTGGGTVSGTFSLPVSATACGSTQQTQTLTGTVTGTVSPGGNVTLTLTLNTGGGGGGVALTGTAQSLTGSLSGAQVFSSLSGGSTATGGASFSMTGVSSGGQTVYSGTATGSGTVQCGTGSISNWTASISGTITVSPSVTSLVTSGGSVSGMYSFSGSESSCNNPQNLSFTGPVTGTVSPGGAVMLNLSGGGGGNPIVVTGTANSVSATLPGTEIFDPAATGSVSISATGVSSSSQTVYSATGSGSGTALCSDKDAGTGTGNWTATISDGSSITVSPSVTSLVTSGGSVSGTWNLSLSETFCGVPKSDSGSGTVTGTVSPGGAVTLNLN